MYEEESDGTAMPMQSSWSDIEIDMVLDSGCSDHVMNVELDAPGYSVRPSESSRQGRGFIVGNGERVPNECETALNLTATDREGREMDFISVFQSAKVTKPLMSVAKICSNGHICKFTDQHALVLDQKGTTVCTFKRQNGIYVARLKLRAPTPFRRQASFPSRSLHPLTCAAAVVGPCLTREGR